MNRPSQDYANSKKNTTNAERKAQEFSVFRVVGNYAALQMLQKTKVSQQKESITDNFSVIQKMDINLFRASLPYRAYGREFYISDLWMLYKRRYPHLAFSMRHGFYPFIENKNSVEEIITALVEEPYPKKDFRSDGAVGGRYLEAGLAEDDFSEADNGIMDIPSLVGRLLPNDESSGPGMNPQRLGFISHEAHGLGRFDGKAHHYYAGFNGLMSKDTQKELMKTRKPFAVLNAHVLVVLREGFMEDLFLKMNVIEKKLGHILTATEYYHAFLGNVSGYDIDKIIEFIGKSAEVDILDLKIYQFKPPFLEPKCIFNKTL